MNGEEPFPNYPAQEHRPNVQYGFNMCPFSRFNMCLFSPVLIWIPHCRGPTVLLPMFKTSQDILLLIISPPKDYSLWRWTQLNWKAIQDLPECLSVSSAFSKLNFRQTVPWWHSKYSVSTLQASAERNRTDGKTLNQDAWTSNNSVYSCRAVLRQINLSIKLQKLSLKKSWPILSP